MAFRGTSDSSAGGSRHVARSCVLFRNETGPVRMDDPQRRQAGDIERKIAAVLLGALGIGCIIVLRPFLSALFWAVILCSSTWPLYDRLEGLLRERRSAAASVMVAGAAAVFLLPLALLASRFAVEATQVGAVVGRLMDAGPPSPPAWVGTLPLLGPRLDAYWQSVAHDGAKLTADLRAHIGPAKEWIVASGVKLAGGLTDLVLALLSSFFLYRDGMAGVDALHSALSRIGGPGAARLLALAGNTIRGVVYGVLGTSFIQATLAAIALHFVGVPGALFLGFLLFFLTLIPLAPAVVFVPAIVWLAHQGAMESAAFLVVWYVIVFVLIEAALRPFLISRGGALPLIVVFLGIAGGVIAFGLLGIFLGPTLLALAHALLREWNSTETRASPMPAEELTRSEMRLR